MWGIITPDRLELADNIVHIGDLSMEEVTVMGIEETSIGGIKTTAIFGRLDSVTSSGYETELMALLQDGRKAMLIDLAGLDYLSSAGIRVLLVLFKHAADAKVSMAILRPPAHVAEILEIAGLDDILTIYPSAEEAAQSLAN
jgi:anti-anti-sigma factor